MEGTNKNPKIIKKMISIDINRKKEELNFNLINLIDK